ncbi:MAG: ribonuclease H [Acidobacteriota bacterium]
MAVKTFHCRECQKDFSIKEETLARFPGWKPAICLRCKDKARAAGGGRRAGSSAAKPRRRAPRRKKKARGAEENLPLAQVLERYTEGPKDGVFTDGACVGNPGPGGWGAVWVRGDEVVEQRYGDAPHTTNNRMQLQALIAAYEMLPEDAELTMWSDSNLCVRTINEWAAGWQRLGWKRKTGPVENLELVQRAFSLAQSRPGVELRWIKAHAGSRWNEYADSLATAFQRDEL